MSHVYRAKPDVVRAMFWDGSKESYLKIKTWAEKNHFLLEETSLWCDYWDEYDAPPEGYDPNANVYLNAQLYDYTYRLIKFYAWGDDQEVDANRWIVFRGSEQDHTDDFPVPRGEILTDEEFRKKFEPV